MKKLGSTGRAWLKGFHILFTCAWIGAGICMFLLNFVARPNNGHDLYVVMTALKLIDDWAIIPSSVGSLFTGLLISWLTPWGFFKWRWVTVKWIITIAMTLFGFFYLSPWLNQMAAISTADPLGALQDETFLTNHWLLSLSGAPMFFAMLCLVFISVFKPWKQTRSAPSAQREGGEQRPRVDGNPRRSRDQVNTQAVQLGDGVDVVPSGQ